ncbi:MAG: TonB-dependent siderophore receptor, partial [Bryobacteraceae bacterium]|nr:TonB-dependent siderophore receptor [Bryobacteraceae bacterium]
MTFAVASLTAWLLVSVSPARAQESGKPDQKKEPLPTVRESITVIGHRLPDEYPGGQVAKGAQLGVLGDRELRDVPFTVQSYTNKLIVDRQARGVADILENDPSARATWSPAAGYAYEEYTIRGILVNSSDVTLNGLYGLSPTGAMPAEAIERLEVFRGPNAMLSGVPLHGSLGGAINVVPKRAPSPPLLTISMSIDSGGHLGPHVDMGRRFGSSKQFGIRANGVYRKGGTAIDRQSLELGFGAAGFDYSTERFQLTLDGGYHIRNRDVPRWQASVQSGFAIPEVPHPSVNIQQPWAHLNVKDVYGMARAEYKLSSNWIAIAAFGRKYSNVDSLLSFATLTNAQGNINQLFAYIPRQYATPTGEAGVRGVLAMGRVNHSVSLIATSLRQDQASFNSFAPGGANNLSNPVFSALPPSLSTTGTLLKDSSNYRASLSLADTLSFEDGRVQLTLGGRFQQVKLRSFARTGTQTGIYNRNAFTPTLGITVRPWSKVSTYMSYIEGLTQANAPGGAINFTEIFPPLRTRQIEVGTKLDLGRFQAGMSFFNITQPKSILNPTTLRYSVDGEQRVRGLDINFNGAPTRRLRLLGGVTILDGEQTHTANGVNQGKGALGVPDWQFNLGADVDLPWINGLTVNGREL